jgi:hypothetical protein
MSLLAVLLLTTLRLIPKGGLVLVPKAYSPECVERLYEKWFSDGSSLL